MDQAGLLPAQLLLLSVWVSLLIELGSSDSDGSSFQNDLFLDHHHGIRQRAILGLFLSFFVRGRDIDLVIFI